MRPFYDDNPGEIKILFIGIGQSTHTMSWIDLLKDKNTNIQLFAMPNSCPPAEWAFKTYVTTPEASRKYSLRKDPIKGMEERIREYLKPDPNRKYLGKFRDPEIGLKEVIEAWNPDIIHTLGLYNDQGGLFYYHCRKKFHLENKGRWVLQLRGGSDLALRKDNPAFSGQIHEIFEECDSIITDNFANIDFIRNSNVDSKKIANIAPVPGTGGLDLSTSESSHQNPPSQRERIILWPKAYESPWSKALPVFEALKLCWKEIAPCEIYLLAVNPEVKMWFWDLPAEIRDHCHIFERIDRSQVFDFLRRARVMLAPSLVDGVPNVLYEAMACGAFPIISPLDTITPIVKNARNVLFAHNLYAQEIATALVTAMTDDQLVDRCTKENLELVHAIADRKTIANRVEKFYRSIANP